MIAEFEPASYATLSHVSDDIYSIHLDAMVEM